jgi:hypothetical protein
MVYQSSKPFIRCSESERRKGEEKKKEESWVCLCLRGVGGTIHQSLSFSLCDTDVHHLFGDKTPNANGRH